MSTAGQTQAAQGPSDVSGGGRWAAVKRAVKEVQEDNSTDWAAALTYYAVLSLFPALIVLVSLVGLAGQSAQATGTLLDIVGQFAPAATVSQVREAIDNIASTGTGALLGVGLLGAVWSASGWVGAFIRAANEVWDVEEGRPFWKTIPLRLVVTVVGLVVTAVILVGLVVSGPLAEAIGSAIGLGGTALTVWNIAKWPVLLILVALMVAVLYYVAPNVKHPRFQFVSPGSAIAVITWIAASALFALYVANFGSYNETYGALAGVVVFLLWIWITNLAILFGAEVNAEIERAKEIEEGLPPEQEPFLPPRDPKED